MGTWTIKIEGNDTFQDIYQSFYELYNNGEHPKEISTRIQNDFVDIFNDNNDRNNSLFALALAQWETKSLDQSIYSQVKRIIETGDDIKLWADLGADNIIINERRHELDRFLAQISTEREKAKRRVKQKFNFKTISLVNAVAPDNLKTFDVKEEFTNETYIHTSGLMTWAHGGGSVLCYTGQGQKVSAKWIDSQTLEITHDKEIVFTMQKDRAYYCGDDIRVIYFPK